MNSITTDPSISTTPSWLVPEPLTMPAAFQATVARVPDRVALRTPGNGVRLTWAQYGRAVEQAAGALAGLGVRRGDRVGFLSRNRPELAIGEVAALHLGAAAVVLYAASPPATITHVLRDSAPRVLMVEQALADRLAGAECAATHLAALDGPAALAGLPSPAGFCFEDAWRAVEPSDLLALLYTSGTTGTPKGVEWEHGAMLRMLDRFDRGQPEPDGSREISVGPFAHLGERGAGHWRSLVRGSTRTFCVDPAQLPQALLDARPSFLFGSPRLWLGLRAGLQRG